VGSVTISDTFNGVTTVLAGNVQVRRGWVRVELAPLAAGRHLLTASFVAGSSAFASSSSSSVTVNVTAHRDCHEDHAAKK
jgi:hypothetical protein